MLIVTSKWGVAGSGGYQGADIQHSQAPGQASGFENNPVFQGLTVQQQLDAHINVVNQQLDKQRQEQNLFLRQLQQQLAGGLAWSVRPSY